MKKSYIIPGLLLLAVLVFTLFCIFNPGISEWQGWAAIASTALIILSVVIVFSAYQYVLMQRRKDSLEQVKFLKSLAEDFSSYRRMFLEVWPILVEYDSVPEEMDDEEWSKVIDALSSCYKSVAFLFKVAQLVKKRIIDEELLYSFYYDEITGYWTQKLRFLTKWCGTGLDLAADYDSYELARIVTATRELVAKLNAVPERYGVDLEAAGYAAELERFEERIRDFLTDPSRYDVSSDNYVGNYVTVKENDGEQ